MTRRVVVTGVGLVCALGIGTEETWKNLVAGQSGVGTITHFDTTGFDCKIAGEIKNFDPFRWIEKKELKKMGRFIQVALAGADFAVKMSGWKPEDSDLDEVGVYVSSGIGGFDIIERGAAEMMICGGTEATITPMGVGGFASMKALSTRNDDPARASRPWDAGRDGFVVGEGAGIITLESLEHAQKRNAPILAEIVGYGMSGDAYHITQPAENGDGAYRVMRAAMKDAKLTPEDIGYVNAHGTSTPLGDVIETRALKRVFGERAKHVPISSTKSMTGHLLGGAGGLEAGIIVLALRDQILPPTINLETPDPECDLDFVPNHARKASVEYALSNSFGFGGTNAALIFKRWSGK